MLNFAICDDDKKQLQKMHASLNQYADNAHENICITEYSSSTELLKDIEEKNPYDILILDICMPYILGTDVAREIRIKESAAQIIFVTSSDEFAVEAFLLKAAHYLVKPFTQKDFDEAVKRAISNLSKSRIKPLSVKALGGDIKIIDLDEIVYIESFSHNQCFHLKNGESFDVRRSMSALLDDLEKISPKEFFSPYKGFIINVQCIKSIESNQIIVRGDVSIPIVKQKYKHIIESYFDFLFHK